MAETNTRLQDLGIDPNILPPELNQNYFDSLDRILQGQEKSGIDRVLNSQEERGLFRSGQSESRIIDEVLGPSLVRRQQALLPIAMQGANQAREERLGTTSFERTRQLTQQEFDNRMKEMAAQNGFQQQLLQLQRSLGIGVPQNRPSGNDVFQNALMGGLGQGLAGMFF